MIGFTCVMMDIPKIEGKLESKSRSGFPNSSANLPIQSKNFMEVISRMMLTKYSDNFRMGLQCIDKIDKEMWKKN